MASCTCSLVIGTPEDISSVGTVSTAGPSRRSWSGSDRATEKRRTVPPLLIAPKAVAFRTAGVISIFLSFPNLGSFAALLSLAPRTMERARRHLPHRQVAMGCPSKWRPFLAEALVCSGFVRRESAASLFTLRTRPLRCSVVLIWTLRSRSRICRAHGPKANAGSQALFLGLPVLSLHK